MAEIHLPKHVAIIMDGNGRWATEHGKSRQEGHKAGYDALVSIVDYAFSKNVEVLSFYAFSTENWSRPVEEVTKLMSLMTKALKYSEKKLIDGKIKFVLSGDYSMVKPSNKRIIDRLIEKTSAFSGKTLNICFNYGGRAEICNAFNRMISEGVAVCDEKTISKYLYTSSLPDPDLIIRTSGEQRLSNFLLWQSAYSELYFTDVYWPDFNGEEFDKAIVWYSSRNRRFGKVK